MPAKQAYGIVLTGGSAKLKDVDELFRRVTGMDVRIASAENRRCGGVEEKVVDPAYATAVGILLKGAEQGACAVIERPAAPASRPAGAAGFQPQQPQAAPESSAIRRGSSSPHRGRLPRRHSLRPMRMPRQGGAGR